MAPEVLKGKKRKGAADTTPKPKKQKKSEDVATKPDIEPSPKIKVPRKRAEDFWDEDTPADNGVTKEKKSKKKFKAPMEVNGGVEAATEKPKKSGKNKNTAVEVELEAVAETPKGQAKKSRKAKAENALPVEDISAVTDGKKSKKDKASKKQGAPKEPSPEAEVEVDGEDDEDQDEDDQTAALLAGFESDRDESDLDKEDEDFSTENFKDKVPKGIMKKLKNVADTEEQSAVIFVGRIPHGFYEPQMKGYFTQFGKVKRVRVSRNKKTGASKHYAFVEFASSEVAEIVAKTMDKYLMFGHILQCSVIPSEQVHPDLFVGANQRYKRMPRSKIVGNEMARGAERAVWEKRVANETKRRTKTNKYLKETLGYEYSTPALKAVEDVPKKTATLEYVSTASQPLEEVAVEDATAEIANPKTDQSAATETAKVKKVKKSAKSTAETDADKTKVAEKHEAINGKPKKAKKPKTEDITEEKVEKVTATGADETPKAKKTKKGAKEDGVAKDVVKEKKRKSLPSADEGGVKPKKSKKAKA